VIVRIQGMEHIQDNTLRIEAAFIIGSNNCHHHEINTLDNDWGK
jgi:hypothetical protein